MHGVSFLPNVCENVNALISSEYFVSFEAEPGTDKVGLELAAAAAFEQEHGDLPIYWLKIIQ